MCSCVKVKSAASCSSCKKIKASSVTTNDCAPSMTGDILYDGTEKECVNDVNFTMSTDENLNDILIKLFDKSCQFSQPTIFSSAAVAEDFSINYAPITDVDVTIPYTGVYEVYGVCNYKHDPTPSVPLIANGSITFGIDGVAIVQPGLEKTLTSEIPAASTTEAAFTASLLYVGSFTAGDVVQILIKSTNAAQRYQSIGGQLIVKRCAAVDVQP
jgi:hypothetical protein